MTLAAFATWAMIGLHAATGYWAGRPPLPCSHTYVAAIVQGGSPIAGQWIEPDGDCIVWINLNGGVRLTGRTVCKLIVHEVGHLRGLQHSADPLSVMYPQPTRVPAGCHR